MAIINIAKKSRKHLICRAQQRFNCPPEDATKYIDNFIMIGDLPVVRLLNF